jgi:hypothetical protein
MTQTPITISQLPDLGSVQGSDRLVLDRIGAAVTAGAFVVGQSYQIISVGNTSFTAIGAESNTVGAYFVATGAGTGTGTAGPINTGDAPLSAVAALLGGDPAGTAAAAVAAHAAAADSHPGYTTPQEAAAVAPVQSVALSVPSGWTTSSTNTGGGVTLTLGLPSGFSLPSNASQTNWDTAYSMRGQWSGGATGLNAATGRASLELGSAALAAVGDFATPSALTTGLAGKADLVGGVIPSSQIPAIAISDYLGAVASQAAMLALTGQRGDWCLRTDGSSAGMWVLSADNAALLANWVQIPVPIVPVQSVNGQTGVITLGPGDVGAATAVQGGLAASAVQPAELASTLSSYLTIANGALTYQPLDGDLSAIAGLSTAAYGRSFLALANAAAGRTWLELGTAATAATGDFATPAALTAGLATKADLVGGVLPSSQIPAIALVQYLGQVSSQAAMLALRGQGGDWCIRTDGGASEWVIVANDGALLADWVQMPTGTAGVNSINGQTGAVTLGTGDLSESGGNLFFTAARAIGSALTGFVAEAGTVAATDSILQAINKIVGNVAAKTQVSNAAPAALAATASAGTSDNAARADHAHQRDTDVIVIPVGDETTALTAGTNKVRFRMPFPATLLAVRDSVNLAPTGSALIVDINEAGTSVLGTKLSIDATETSSTTAASAATITDTSLADDAEISIDIDQIGSTVAAAGLKVYLFVRRT